MRPFKDRKTDKAATASKDDAAQCTVPSAKRRLGDVEQPSAVHNLVHRIGSVSGMLAGADAIEYARVRNATVYRRDLLGLETLRTFSAEEARKLYDDAQNTRWLWYMDVMVTKLLLPERYYMPQTPERAPQTLPWSRAMMYVTDGTLYGILDGRGIIEWTGDSLQHAFGPELHE